MKGNYSEQWQQRPSLYINLRNGKFKDAAEEAGPDFRKQSAARGAAFADFDNDGDVDVVIANMSGSPILLRTDRQDHNHWLTFKTVGRKSNRDGIGARISVETPHLRQIREIRRTVGIYSSSDSRAWLGIGTATGADVVSIKWPSGLVQQFRDVVADRHYLIDEEKGLKNEHIFRIN